MSRINYKQYLKSDKWRDKKQELFDLKGKECEQCGSTDRIHVHHLTYKNFGNESLEDLQILCYMCHMSKHDKYFNKYVLKDKLPKKPCRKGYMYLDSKSLNALKTAKGGLNRKTIKFLNGGKRISSNKKGWFKKCIGKEVLIKDYQDLIQYNKNWIPKKKTTRNP